MKSEFQPCKRREPYGQAPGTFRHLAHILAVAMVFVCIAPLVAQDAVPPADEAGKDTGASGKEAGIIVSLVAVGDPPDPGFTIANSRRVLADIADSEYPPTLLHVPKAENKGKPDPITLGLNLPGQPLKLKPTTSLRLMEAIPGGEEITYKDWTTVKLPAGLDDLSVFLYRSSPRASWRKSPNAVVLNNNLLSFPARHIRLINFSEKQIAFQIEKSPAIHLAAKQVKIVPAGSAKYCTYSVAYKDGEEVRIIAQHQACTMHGDTRVNLVAYDTDSATSPARGQGPVNLKCFYELPPPPKPPPVPVSGSPPATSPPL